MTKNRQGMDTGTQYRSAVFYHSPEQKQEAEEVTEKVGEQWWKGKVTTEILEAGQCKLKSLLWVLGFGRRADDDFFIGWDAEDYHQLYLDKNPGGYECPAHYVRSFPDLQ